MRLYMYLGGALLGLAALIGAYFYGRSDGRTIERDKQAAVDIQVARERKAREDMLDYISAEQKTQETDRQSTVKEVYRESTKVVEGKPVYRNVCVDAAGVQILDTAAANANGENTRVQPTGAPDAPPSSSE